MNKLSLKWTAFKIEYHWWRIRKLTKRANQGKVAYRIALHRFQASQLQHLYHVGAGICNFSGQIVQF